ncbi:5'/3'-nucleotidase SurE [Amylibacter kogurei]|uniref:5'-nucleotidase SurE n=1 Tax=Paramylibacter kogurei TaxID=1889778 RepID=A0A2G5K5Q2_9RHOB|nr:5'/3'-nucleotidase SurE [Amylibacter kogurei]PIB24352.1 5'/3'-nucleotidase SurE [Amylibacter kogurei]
MRILITNDDGIDAPGLAVLLDIARKLTDANNITTVAPAVEQSGVGHCITYTNSLHYDDRGDSAFAVHGSPADCVIAGVFEILGGNKPDLILSGVNKGNNAAQNTLYSGTVGATIEAAMHDIKSIALSQFYGPALADCYTFDPARSFGVETVQKILDADAWAADQGMLFYNVNFPPVPAAEVLGHKITRQGFRHGSPFSTERRENTLWIKGTPQHASTAAGTDVHANLAGYISVTPCHVDLTAHAQIAQLKEVF